MFLDQTKITVEAGKGGDGAVSFLHEKYRPLGGPDGGDGGNGGDIIFEAKRDIVTLGELDRKRYFQAESGQNGMKNRKKGKRGEDLKLFVPLGTIIKDKKEKIADLISDGQQVKIVSGGQGGWGNWHFKSSIKQAPTWSKKGKPGEKKELDLELKLIADVGIIGLPNAGKSTLLSRVSNARPKIADYVFTTLSPNLGVVKIHQKEYVFADIPGLIEGAHLGRGLGIKFLRHIERTKLIIHLIPADSHDYLADYQIIRKELGSFNKNLLKKPEIVAINKAEIVAYNELTERIKQFESKGKKLRVVTISAATGRNINELLKTVAKNLEGK